jgi:phosphate butyryltransferase
MIMKGMLPTGDFLRALLAPEAGIRKEGGLISAVAIFDVPELARFMLLTDPGFIPAPDLKMKAAMIRNAVEVAHKLGIDRPKVAALCASETVDEKIPATVDAQRLAQMNLEGEIEGCCVAGPISFDLAVSEKSAKRKNYSHEVAGKADILVAPGIEAANLLYKAISYFGKLKSGGVMVGARVPIIFSSRADSAETKLNTIAFSAYLAGR